MAKKLSIDLPMFKVQRRIIVRLLLGKRVTKKELGLIDGLENLLFFIEEELDAKGIATLEISRKVYP
jgi:hypothetical protein